jgi:hypothetical protein
MGVTEMINTLHQKMTKTYLKLLKASVKGKQNKMAKLEAKLIQLELEAKNFK